MHRRQFIHAGSAFGPALIAPSAYLFGGQNAKGEQLSPELVKAFVGAGHNDLAKVQAMWEEHPTLVYAAWDWGGGDFETALEGAGHVGNRAIANWLIEKGARPNLFVLAMLGKTAMVKMILEAFPQYLHARGAHGFTLLHHAIRGGDEAKELAVFLEASGLTETKLPL